mmetsp:Transcript_39755/g.127372  ORF Transcript_39755/g.127372 Transcript_39755/m.127372 type:complete len:323 (-) Transcript_39755:82-1050(-)
MGDCCFGASLPTQDAVLDEVCLAETQVVNADVKDDAGSGEAKDVIVPSLLDQTLLKCTEAPSAAAEAAPVVPAAPPSSAEKPFQDKTYHDIIGSRPEFVQAAIPGIMKRRPSSENITMQDYTEKHKNLFEKVLELEKPDDWIFKREDNGVRIYTKAVAGCRLLYFKGYSEFHCEEGIAGIMQKMFKTEDRPKWDDMCLEAITPQSFPPFYKYAYVRLKSPVAIISERDLCTLGRSRFEPDGSITIAIQAAQHPDHPERSDHVRIEFVEGGYVIRQKGPKDFGITWTGCVDPKGWLPTWVANLAVTKQAMSLAKFKAFMNTQQ